jgi:hypothetical protein
MYALPRVACRPCLHCLTRTPEFAVYLTLLPCLASNATCSVQWLTGDLPMPSKGQQMDPGQIHPHVGGLSGRNWLWRSRHGHCDCRHRPDSRSDRHGPNSAYRILFDKRHHPVDVAFIVTAADNSTDINAPDTIETSDRRNCTLKDDAMSEYCCGQLLGVMSQCVSLGCPARCLSTAMQYVPQAPRVSYIINHSIP